MNWEMRYKEDRKEYEAYLTNCVGADEAARIACTDAGAGRPGTVLRNLFEKMLLAKECMEASQCIEPMY